MVLSRLWFAFQSLFQFGINDHYVLGLKGIRQEDLRIAGDVVIELLTVIVVPIVRCAEQSTVVRIAKTFRKTNKINIK